MKWIGLTGGIATGKSTVAESLRRRGFHVIDADRVVHQLMAPGTPAYHAIVKEFGAEIVQADGTLDRRELGRRVFAHPEQLKKLEDLLHPHVRHSVHTERQRLSSLHTEMAFYDVPLLFEKNMEEQFDATLCVAAPLALQQRRMRERNKWSESEIEDRLRSQLDLDEKRRRASFVIENDGSLEELEQRLESVLEKLKIQ